MVHWYGIDIRDNIGNVHQQRFWENAWRWESEENGTSHHSDRFIITISCSYTVPPPRFHNMQLATGARGWFYWCMLPLLGSMFDLTWDDDLGSHEDSNHPTTGGWLLSSNGKQIIRCPKKGYPPVMRNVACWNSSHVINDSPNKTSTGGFHFSHWWHRRKLMISQRWNFLEFSRSFPKKPPGMHR